MKRDSKKKPEIKAKNFNSDYNGIINSFEKSVVIQTEWKQEGDFFQKLSIYDNSYVQVETLGNTTLIKTL